MASPQLEDGYTKFPNGLLERLMQAQVGAVEMACILAVIRRSWGWGKREAEISLKQFAEMTARPVGSVRQCLSVLQKKRIIARVSPPAFDRAALWRVETNPELWQCPPFEEKQKGGGVYKIHHSLSKNIDSRKNHTPQGGILSTPPSHILYTPPSDGPPETMQNQSPAPARNLQKESIKKIKEIKKGAGKKTADARHQPLVDYFFNRFEESRGYKFFAVPADFKGLQDLLKRTQGKEAYSVESIQAAMDRFFKNDDPFYLKQGKPLAYFCGNIHAFMQEQHGSPQADQYVGRRGERESAEEIENLTKRRQEETERILFGEV